MKFDIKKVAVLGAGTMGAGIAAHIAGAGIPVVLLDIVPKELTDQDKEKGLTIDSKEFRNKFSYSGKEQVTHRKYGVIYEPKMESLIEIGNLEDDLDKLKDCDWVIEVIVENLNIKRDLFTKIIPYLGENTIISTNTSGIPIAKIAEGMPENFQKNFLGTHFFNPPRFMRLLELIPGKETEEELCDYMKGFSEKILGKGVVVAKDTPNFIGNRIGSYATTTIMQLMEKYQLDIMEVDQITGQIMGRPKTATFKTIDMVGLDIFYHVNNNLIESLSNENEKEMFEFPKFAVEMFENGQLGNKTKQGFYKKVKDQSGRKTLVWDIKNKEYVPFKLEKVKIVEEANKEKTFKEKIGKLIYSAGKESEFAWDVIKNTLIYSANKVPEITEDYRAIDKAMKWGYNWEYGPFEIWDMIGVEKSVKRMQEEGETIPDWIKDMLDGGQEVFYEDRHYTRGLDKEYNLIKSLKDANMIDMGDGVIGVELKSKGNSITIPFIESLHQVIEEVENNPDYKGIVLANSSKNFCTGADLLTFKRIIAEDSWDGVQEALDYFHGMSMKLKYAKKPIVAAVHGMVLGGGLEFSMHCPRVVAHTETYMGLVEVGVGIVPGGGGIKEYLYRMMDKVEGFEISDTNPVVRKVLETIFGAKVSKNAFDAKNLGFLRESDKIVMNIDDVVHEAKKEVLRMSEDGFRRAAKKKVRVGGISGKASMDYIIETMRTGKMISEYDSIIGKELSYAITGGNVPKGTYLTEEELLDLESEVVSKLIKNKKTHDRIDYMLSTGKPLRN